MFNVISIGLTVTCQTCLPSAAAACYSCWAGNKPTRNSLHATVITGASRDATATAAAAVQKIHRAQMVMKQPLQNTFTHSSDRNFRRHDIKVIAYRLPRECAKKVCYVEQQQHRHLTGLRQRADAHHISSHTRPCYAQLTHAMADDCLMDFDKIYFGVDTKN